MTSTNRDKKFKSIIDYLQNMQGQNAARCVFHTLRTSSSIIVFGVFTLAIALLLSITFFMPSVLLSYAQNATQQSVSEHAVVNMDSALYSRGFFPYSMSEYAAVNSDDSVSDKEKLSEYTWEELITIAKDIEINDRDSIYYSAMWNILISGAGTSENDANCKTITTADDEGNSYTCNVVLVQVGSHYAKYGDTQNDGSGLTFQIQAFSSSASGLPPVIAISQSGNTSDYWYEHLALYSDLDIYQRNIKDAAGIYGSLQENMLYVEKSCANSAEDGDTRALYSKLWLPSWDEFSEDSEQAKEVCACEGTQYVSVSPNGQSNYKGLSNNNSCVAYWLRSPDYSNADKWLVAGQSGVSTMFKRAWCWPCCPCFSLGNEDKAPKTLSITYVTNGGSFVKDYTPSYSYALGDCCSVPTEDKIKRYGYFFGGWYTDEACLNAPITEIGGKVQCNTVLYAKWIEKEKLSDYSWGELKAIARDIHDYSTWSSYYEAMCKILTSSYKDKSGTHHGGYLPGEHTNCKTLTTSGEDGTQYTCNVVLVQVGDHDDDGSGLTFQIQGRKEWATGLPVYNTEAKNSSATSYYEELELYEDLKTYYNNIEDSAGEYGMLKDAIHYVSKECLTEDGSYKTLEKQYLWLPSLAEYQHLSNPLKDKNYFYDFWKLYSINGAGDYIYGEEKQYTSVKEGTEYKTLLPNGTYYSGLQNNVWYDNRSSLIQLRIDWTIYYYKYYYFNTRWCLRTRALYDSDYYKGRADYVEYIREVTDSEWYCVSCTEDKIVRAEAISRSEKKGLCPCFAL